MRIERGLARTSAGYIHYRTAGQRPGGDAVPHQPAIIGADDRADRGAGAALPAHRHRQPEPWRQRPPDAPAQHQRLCAHRGKRGDGRSGRGAPWWRWARRWAPPSPPHWPATSQAASSKRGLDELPVLHRAGSPGRACARIAGGIAAGGCHGLSADPHAGIRAGEGCARGPAASHAVLDGPLQPGADRGRPRPVAGDHRAGGVRHVAAGPAAHRLPDAAAQRRAFLLRHVPPRRAEAGSRYPRRR